MLMFKEMRQNFTDSNLLGHTGNTNLKMISTLISILFLNVLSSFRTSVGITLIYETNKKDL
jgi:hypothetical protein